MGFFHVCQLILKSSNVLKTVKVTFVWNYSSPFSQEASGAPNNWISPFWSHTHTHTHTQIFLGKNSQREPYCRFVNYSHKMSKITGSSYKTAYIASFAWDDTPFQHQLYLKCYFVRPLWQMLTSGWIIWQYFVLCLQFRFSLSSFQPDLLLLL